MFKEQCLVVCRAFAKLANGYASQVGVQQQQLDTFTRSYGKEMNNFRHTVQVRYVC